MVLRFLMRYFANNEQLVQKLSESYPVRRAAQLAVAVFFRSKNLAEEHKLNQLNPDRFKYAKKKPNKFYKIIIFVIFSDRFLKLFKIILKLKLKMLKMK